MNSPEQMMQQSDRATQFHRVADRESAPDSAGGTVEGREDAVARRVDLVAAEAL